MSVLKNVLQTNNAHIRDKDIQFYEPTHTYTIIPDAKSKYKSVTTWNHSHFPHFDADDIIKKMMKSKGWKSVGVQMLLAILYIAAAIFTWSFPIPALEAITLWMAAIFFATGVLRLIAAFQHRHFNEWIWLVLSAALSILMGVLIMNSYPASSLWLPGLLIAIELILQGWSLLFLGLAAKSVAKSLTK
jgi:hypothetical protein